MLKRIGNHAIDDTAVPIAEANYPQPKPWTLEYCPPVYESWNIVHIGMLLPEAHQIYVCADNCMRGVTMTAAEMGQADRFHCVIIEEKDMLYTNLEQITIEGVSDIIGKLPARPPAVLVFTVCVHHFLGSDIDYIYRELEKRFPDITFIRCWMDPVMQKNHRMPDVTERAAMLDVVPQAEPEPKTVNILGADLPHDADSELMSMLRGDGYRVQELPRCSTYQDFLSFGKAALNIVTYPSFLYGAEQFSSRLGREMLYLPPVFSYEEIDRELEVLAGAIGVPSPNTADLRADCERALAETQALVGDTPVYLDYIAHTRPLGMARLLLEHGFRVERVYIDVISAEEETDFQWLRRNHPDLMLFSTIRPKMRVLQRGESNTLAIGPKAAYYADTAHFVNMVEAGGTWGYTGILKLCERMRDAFCREKDLRDHVIRKGLGCESLI